MARVKHHFKVVKLSHLYTSHAAVELEHSAHSGMPFPRQAPMGFKLIFSPRPQVASGCTLSDSWQTATYRALSTSDWYCNGGFA